MTTLPPPRAAVPAPSPRHTAQPRLLVLWVPDWPVVAHARAERIGLDEPVALVEKGEVFACSAVARSEGVRRGSRIREAQARCPGLRVIRYDAALDARAFEPVLVGLEHALPGLHPLRPGTVAVRARGPARYYGGEQAAALSVLGTVAGLVGDHDSPVAGRVGIADGLFAAEQAARHTLGARSDGAGSEEPAHGGADPRITRVPPGATAEFLAPLAVGLLEQPELVSLLPRLGIRSLGEFAALAESDVAARFGPDGSRLHALAAGRDPRPAQPRLPPDDAEVQVDFEPPLDRVDQVAFGVRTACDDLVGGLLARRLVCTALRVELIGERGEASERVWLHPRSFSAAEVVDRVRWQLDAATRPTAGTHRREDIGELVSAVARVRLSPDSVDPVGDHERGLWGTGPDERVHSGLSRVQGMLGHRGVLTAVPSGGRGPADRQTLVPWGDRPLVPRSRTRPWPGALPDPAPATVYELPRRVDVQDGGGRLVVVDDRGMISAPPSLLLSPDGARRMVTSWAGPWPIEERWWDADAHRRANRFQIVDAEGDAWLLVLDDGVWWAEGRYD